MSLQAPQNLQGTVVSDTEIALSWDSVAGAGIYRVRGGPTTPITDKTFFNVTGLEPGTTYEFTIVAEGLGGAQLESVFSPPSDPVTLTTLDAGDSGDSGDVPDSLAAPGIISAEQTGVDEATITWGAVTDATGYEVRVDGGAEQDVGNALGYTETGFALGDYDFEVRAYAGDGPDIFGAWSTAVTVTISGLVAPDPTATVLSSGAIEVTWPAVPPADRYQVRIDNDKVFSAGSLTEYIDSGLAPVTTRSYEVRGLVDGTALVGPWSAPIEATTNRSSVIEIIGRLRRLSAYLSDRHITARSLNAEFNNIYALLNGGTLVEQGPGEAEVPGPAPPPEPEPDAQISIDPGSFDFGTTNVGGGGGTRLVVVSNPGTVNNKLGNVSLDSPDFSIDDDRCSGETLEPGDSCFIKLAFSPTEAGLRIADVTLPSQAPSSPHVLPVTGTGEALVDPDPDPQPDPDDPPPAGPEAVTLVTKVTEPVTGFDVPLPEGAVGDALVIFRLGYTQTGEVHPAGWTRAEAVRYGSSDMGVNLYLREATGSDAFTFSAPSGRGNQIFVAARVGRSFVPEPELSNRTTLYAGRSSGLNRLPEFETFGAGTGISSTFSEAGFMGEPALVCAGAAYSGASDPGVLSSSNFPGMPTMQLVKNLQRDNPDVVSGSDLVLPFSLKFDEALQEGDGAGVGRFSNPDYTDARGITFSFFVPLASS